ncbi:MAG TPA: PHP domain-containing protein [Candidatus Limnocylindrales bacterium]|jgi:predicted metal-dependent phosphoesterase TrpH|nr:PHP domain-containing protein [Candidatus Limnocylindrales bacterium]
MSRFFIDLHCHTNASFDSLSDPASVVKAAATRGLTHLAITDHDRIEGALRARDAAPAGLQVIVGEEVRTADGDLIALFLEQAVEPHRPARETIEAVRAQGGLVGIPHPFDKFRGSMLKDPRLEAMAQLVDWVETHNARVVGGSGNERAQEFAREMGLPGVAVSDAHSVLEVGVAYTALDSDPSTPEGLLAALTKVELVPGRASYIVRTLTPVAKLINRARGNRRLPPPSATSEGPA